MLYLTPDYYQLFLLDVALPAVPVEMGNTYTVMIIIAINVVMKNLMGPE